MSGRGRCHECCEVLPRERSKRVKVVITSERGESVESAWMTSVRKSICRGALGRCSWVCLFTVYNLICEPDVNGDLDCLVCTQPKCLVVMGAIVAY